MISTRTHAAIDYAVSGALAALALCPALSQGARRALGAASVYHPSYSVLTDYEGGVSGRISMRQHLALDFLGAAGLCAAASLVRSARDRRLLLALAAAEFAVIALSDPHPGEGAPETAYHPLDEPKPVADGLWIVDSVIGPHAPVRMTVIRLPGGELMLHSPTRYDRHLRIELERLGRISHLVAPNIAHWTFMKEWQDMLPATTTWAAPGLRKRWPVRRSGLRLDHDLADTAPPEWSELVEQAVVPGGAGFSEVAMFHRPSRTLLLADLVVNLEPEKLPWPLRALTVVLGGRAPEGKLPAYLRAVVNMRRAQAADAARRMLAWNPERVVMSHGRPFVRDGAQRLGRSLQWLLG